MPSRHMWTPSSRHDRGTSLSSISTRSRRGSSNTAATASRQGTSRTNDARSRRSISSTPNGRPGTTASSFGAVESRGTLCAVSESRGATLTVGLAFVSLATGEAILSQICDTHTYVRTIQKLSIYVPTDILISASSTVGAGLHQVVQDVADETGARVVTLDRKYWAEATGLHYIQSLALRDDVEALKVSLEDSHFATCCVAAVLKYIEVSLARTFAQSSLRVRYEPSEGSVMIDGATARALELIENLREPKSGGSLLGLMNRTLTPMGHRLLRNNILQPLTDAESIELRYEAVDELSSKEGAFFATREALKGFVDTDKLLASIVIVPINWTLASTEKSINDVIRLKQMVSCVKPIFEALAGTSSVLLGRVREICNPARIEIIQTLIQGVINEDATFAKQPLDLRNQRTYAVKSGVNGLLDVARQTYTESISDAFQHAKELAENTQLNVELQYDNARQFYLRIPAADLEDRPLPDEFVNCFRRKRSMECQTLDLMKINQKVADSHNEVLLMSTKAVDQLLEEVREYVMELAKVSESVAMLDLISNFAHSAADGGYVRPKIGNTLAVKDGRHPIRDKIQLSRFVPNDVYASSGSRFQIVTGANMSGSDSIRGSKIAWAYITAGKSTYIRSIALVAVMAQIGSFIPAQYAAVPIVRQLFARTSTQDAIGSNVSTFALEMREMAFILRNVGPGDLVIIDELGRGTSTRDGLAIALAMAEALVESKAFVWFATHFSEVARAMRGRVGVKNLHLAVKFNHQDDVEMQYRIAEGPAKEMHHGLALARTLPFGRRVIDRGMEVAEALEAQSATTAAQKSSRVEAHRRRLVHDLVEELKQADAGTLKGKALAHWLVLLRQGFVEKMSGTV